MAYRKRRIREARVIMQDDDSLLYERPEGEDGPVTQWGKYVDSGFDRKHLVFRPGEDGEATIWTLRALTWPQRNHLEAIDEGWTRIKFVFRCGLKAIENYIFDDSEPGGEVEPVIQKLAPVARVRDEELGLMVTESWMAEAQLSKDEIIGVAKLVMALSESSVPFSMPSHMPSGLTESNKSGAHPAN